MLKRVTKRCYSKPLNSTITATTCAGLASNDISDNTPEVTFLYDGFLAASQPPTASPNFAKGKLTRVASSVSDTRYTGFDTLGRLTESIQRTPFGTESVENATPRVSKYAYNFAGVRRSREAYPRRESSAMNTNRTATSAGSGERRRTRRRGLTRTSFSYTPDGKIERLKLGNNRWEWAKFNERNQVTELNLGAGVTDASLWKLTYHYGELNADGRTVDAAKNTGNIAMQTVLVCGTDRAVRSDLSIRFALPRNRSPRDERSGHECVSELERDVFI
ncbi:MAG: hypothetical protein IPJ30_21750 [Acidobacteria bacterium]|nr:hypothetical protein [Acidobacteriota bacterium]